MRKISLFGHGMCQKLRDGQPRISILQHARQQPEVIVLDKDERRVSIGFLEHRFGKDLVCKPVAFPVFAQEARALEGHVAERP